MTLKLYRIALCAIASLVLLGTGGCQTLTDVYNKIFNPRPQMPDGPGVEATIWPGPRVRPGVALAITVTASGITNRDSKQYFVDAEGCITMELIGSIKVDQLSLMQLQQKITAAYKEFYVDPSVTATFIYQPGQNMVSPWGTITVLGEVRRPGPVDMPATEEMNLTRVLMVAGGVTSMANKNKIQVTRCMPDGTQKKTFVDLEEIGKDGRPDKDMVLKAGDVVWVPVSYY